MTLPTTVALKDGRTATLRRAREGDARDWITHVNAVGSEQIYLMTETLRHSPREIRAQFRESDPDRELWMVAELDRRLVAGADFRRGVHLKNAHVATLGVSVAKPFRGLGLGEAMMRCGIDWAREVGVTRLRLGVFATNANAIALYRKLGFAEEGRLKGEAVIDGKPVDEILMARLV